MAIASGTRIGVYEVVALLGKGGMGEVYRAHDTRLNRDVALKVLPEAFSRDFERMARFEREAKVLASLNHPNIAAIYGLEESGPIRALVMELVEGTTLADRIRGGPIPIDEALPIARQVADAVEYAHDHNVIHRDLKPANIKVKDDGTVKVLDFGLAKAMSEDLAERDMSNSPTLSMAATRQGVILGTAAYMSPEQAKGKTVDRRTDVWAFGAVLYEMLTGQQPFPGEGVTEILAAIVMKEAAFDALPAKTAPAIRNLLRRCLEKTLRRRLGHISEARIVIEDVLSGAEPAEPAAEPSPRVLSRPALAFSLGALLLGATIAGIVAWALQPVTPAAVRRFDYALPRGLDFRNTGLGVIAISPDGHRFVFNGTDGLYLRTMDETEARRIPGTDENLTEPFFSPDGQSIGYFQRGQLKRISLTGGTSVVICPVRNGSGADWGRDNMIVFSQADGIWRVAAEGGTPVRMAESETGENLVHPRILPGGEWILVTAFKGGSADGDVVLQSLRTKERRILLRGGSDARYVPTGHLVYVVGDALFAAAFDLGTMKLSSERIPMAQGLQRAPFDAGGNYAFAEDGSLVYVSGQTLPAKTLVWVSRDGAAQAIDTIRAGRYDSPRLSPDGKRILVWADHDGWIYEIASGRATRLTNDGSADTYGEWDPTGSRVAYSSSRGSGIPNAWVQPADGSGEPRRLTELPGIVHVDSWSPDGRALAVHYHMPDGGSNLLIVPMAEAKPEPKEFLKGKSNEAGTVFSPDGRYVAYLSEESGQGEVYIRPYPGPGGRSTVSVGGGREPMWGKSGEVFYRNLTGDRMMAVAVKTEPTLTMGTPRELFGGRYYLSPSRRPQYDVTADGQRFLMLQTGPTDSSAVRPSIEIVLNWFEELKRRVPTGTK